MSSDQKDSFESNESTELESDESDGLSKFVFFCFCLCLSVEEIDFDLYVTGRETTQQA